MAELFLKIVNMSFSAGWLVLAVLVLRLCLTKAPKWVSVLLWGIVAARLLCPFSIESALSLIPSAEVISPDIMMDRTPEITTGFSSINSVVNPIITESFTPKPTESVNPLQIWIPAASIVWLLGMSVMLFYAAVSYLRLRRKIRTATRLYGNIFQSARIPSPFVLGIVKPKIYLPFGMNEGDMAHVIAHEQAHIRRKDHWWKPLGFALLAVHWFNPLMWTAYVLLCRDIELACDEKVVQGLSRDQRADYSQALLSFSVNRRMIAACPLAFGEVGVKERVKNVLSYRKAAFWVVVMAVVLCAVVAVCFLTNPEASREFSMNGTNVADLDAQQITGRIADIENLEDHSDLYVNANNFSLTLTADFDWANSAAIRYFYYRNQKEYSGQLRIFEDESKFYVTESGVWTEQNRIFLLYNYLQALQYLPQDAIRAMCSDADGYIVRQFDEGNPDSYDRVITYSADGTGQIDGWLIHLELQPLHDADVGQVGTGEEVIHLFYGDAYVEVSYGIMKWFDFGVPEVYDYPIDLEKKHPAFRGVTFQCDGGTITAEAENGVTTVIQGMPIWDAWFTDLTGDGFPEICATVSFGSGLIDTHVVVYDYADGQEYTLWARGSYDYYLREENGRLMCDQHTFANGPVDKGELLATGELMIADNGDGRFLTFGSAVSMPASMQPTEANLQGLYAGYLFIPIQGATYRYELTDPKPANVTAGQLLDCFTEETHIEGIVWEVYALNEHPDLTKLLLVSGTNSAWLCEYAPAKRAPEDALQWAKNDGCVIVEDGALSENEDTWLDFYEKTQNGIPASVMLAWYNTLNPETTARETYEAYQEDYPMLDIHELSYDGEIYTLYTDDGVRTYEYLMKYTGTNNAVSWSQIDEYHRYVLTHSNTVTWEELWSSMASSAAGVAIDHFTICAEIY